MSENNATIVTRLFNDPAQAEATRVQLARAGFPPDAIEVAIQGGLGTGPPSNTGPRRLRSRGGATLGAILGGMIGCLLGTLIATGAIPIVGPLLDGAALAGIVGCAAGLAAGSLLGALIGWGLTSDSIGFSGQELGFHTLIRVHCNGRASEAAAILRNGKPREKEPSSALLDDEVMV
jgi:hypothetical protein